MWRLSWTSGYSYSRVATIWIDVHPVGKNSINMTCTLSMPVCIRPAYASCEQSPYMTTFHEPSTESLLSRKRAPNTIHSTPANWSVGSYPVSLPSQPMKQWRRPNLCRQQATRLTGLISPVCDRYVQYLLAGANPSFLNRYRRGLQSWRCRLATSHSPIFSTDGPPLST
jgi:hypothetical protein